jgi:hypothetical protein
MISLSSLITVTILLFGYIWEIRWKVFLGVGICKRIVGRDYSPITGNDWVRAKGHPELGKELLLGLMKKGFDIAFSLELPTKEKGMPHGFVRPAFFLTPNYGIPILPFHVNGFYAPQPSGRRCYELGRAIREVIEQSSQDLKVAVLGSGGLWHTPGVPGAYIDEEFDLSMLRYVKTGEAQKLAAFFDDVLWPYASATPEVAKELVGGIGLAVGPGSGVGESRVWLVAAAVADGIRGTVLDYVPVYASPHGESFAYWGEK